MDRARTRVSQTSGIRTLVATDVRNPNPRFPRDPEPTRSRCDIRASVHSGFGFSPSVESGFGFCPSGGEKRPWMSKARTLSAQTSRIRTLVAATSGIRTRVASDVRNPRPHCHRRSEPASCPGARNPCSHPAFKNPHPSLANDLVPHPGSPVAGSAIAARTLVWRGFEFHGIRCHLSAIIYMIL